MIDSENGVCLYFAIEVNDYKGHDVYSHWTPLAISIYAFALGLDNSDKGGLYGK
jgi:hypothetical protein